LPVSVLLTAPYTASAAPLPPPASSDDVMLLPEPTLLMLTAPLLTARKTEPVEVMKALGGETVEDDVTDMAAEPAVFSK
jgi:hypothetical protein